MEETRMILERIQEFFTQAKLGGLLKGIDFPITKQELIDLAEEYHAPDKVTELIDKLPDQVFDSLPQVIALLRGWRAQEPEETEEIGETEETEEHE
jgi:hypothetical protein